MSGWMWLWGVAMMILPLALFLWFVRVGQVSAGPLPQDPMNRAREILAERYASGELSTEEFRKRIAELQ